MGKKSRVRFGRSESWHSGWKGKISTTPIYVDEKEWGELAGEEPIPGGGMGYKVKRADKLPVPMALQLFILPTRKELRAAIIAYFDERKDLTEKKG